MVSEDVSSPCNVFELHLYTVFVLCDKGRLMYWYSIFQQQGNSKGFYIKHKMQQDRI